MVPILDHQILAVVSGLAAVVVVRTLVAEVAVIRIVDLLDIPLVVVALDEDLVKVLWDHRDSRTYLVHRQSPQQVHRLDHLVGPHNHLVHSYCRHTECRIIAHSNDHLHPVRILLPNESFLVP